MNICFTRNFQAGFYTFHYSKISMPNLIIYIIQYSVFNFKMFLLLCVCLLFVSDAFVFHKEKDKPFIQNILFDKNGTCTNCRPDLHVRSIKKMASTLLSENDSCCHYLFLFPFSLIVLINNIYVTVLRLHWLWVLSVEILRKPPSTQYHAMRLCHSIDMKLYVYQRWPVHTFTHRLL